SVGEISPEWPAQVAGVTGKDHQFDSRFVPEKEITDLVRFCQAGERLGDTGIERLGGVEFVEGRLGARGNVNHSEHYYRSREDSEPPAKLGRRAFGCSVSRVHSHAATQHKG